MRIQAYLRVVSDEATIRAIHKDASIPGATIKQLKAPRGTGGDDWWWNWGTEPVNLDLEDVDRGVKALLLQCRPFFPDIRKYPETDIYLEVVTRYDEGDRPEGLYLSNESISLLSELGGALDYDTCPDVS